MERKKVKYSLYIEYMKNINNLLSKDDLAEYVLNLDTINIALLVRIYKKVKED